MKPLYIPKGKAKEYGDYAVNIYTGCPHRCYYCFAPNVLHREREKFYSCVEPRPGIVQALKSQLQRERIAGQTIHLCFTCDPYPTGYDTTVTREVITAIKESGNHVQILTKGIGVRDLDLLDGQDWFGVTIDGWNRGNNPVAQLKYAHSKGIKTWISFEPVLDAFYILRALEDAAWGCYADKVTIGKLNYHSSAINWRWFGEQAEQLCRELGIDYYIKESLRKEMEG
jgi:hypothetical protein